jgi:hypothetical protein
MRRVRRLSLLLVLGAAVTLAAAAGALADTAVLPPDAPLPWSSPEHQSPLEQLVDPIATQVAGRAAAVRCEGDTDWGSLSAQKSLPEGVWGYVEFPGGSPLDFTELSPQACTYLQRFAEAESKPTRCAPLQTVTVQRRVTTHPLVSVRRRRNGHWVTTRVRRTIHATVTSQATAPGPSVPCWTTEGLPAMELPSSYWEDYVNYTMALLTLAHEPFHIAGDRNEATVNCHGLQRLPLVAEALGDAPDDAEQIARFAQQILIPKGQPAQYQLPAECRDGGSLDLNPGSSVWP